MCAGPGLACEFFLPKFAEKTLKCSVRADILCMTKKARSKPTTTGAAIAIIAGCDARNIVHCSDLNMGMPNLSDGAIDNKAEQAAHGGALACLAC